LAVAWQAQPVVTVAGPGSRIDPDKDTRQTRQSSGIAQIGCLIRIERVLSSYFFAALAEFNSSKSGATAFGAPIGPWSYSSVVARFTF
ncbi:MAG TPA: hypothetical protein VK678_13370, partial [Bradyrhizobium sp.]|nr:hypothetical protein [Bradyrhizobium sp.]